MNHEQNINHQNDSDVCAQAFDEAVSGDVSDRSGRWIHRWGSASLFKRGMVAGALTLTTLGGAVAVTEQPAQALAIGTVACESQSQRHATRNVLGQVVHGVTNSVKVCAKLSRAGWRFQTPTTNASHEEQYLWNWVGWNGNYKSGGAGSTSFTYYTKGTFKQCTTVCWLTESNWVKQTATIKNPQNVNIGGTYGMDIVWGVTGGRSVESEVKNQAPVAQGNSMGFTFLPTDPIGTQKCNSINVLSNDADPDGDALTSAATGANFTNNAPAGTYFTLQPDGTFNICVTRGAANNFGPTNPLVVSYVATDSKGVQSQPATVTITPSLVNAAPVAQANSMGFTFRPADGIGTQKCNSINVLSNDADPDGDALTAVATGANFANNAPAGTYYTLQPDGTFSICVTRGAANSFSPANPLAVSYVAVDSKGTQSQPVNVVIAPSLVNSAPSAGSNSMGFTFRAADAVGTQKCNAINVLTNDGDADGDPLTAVATGANFNNNAPNGTYFTMQPNGTFSICVTRGAANSFSPANPLLVTYVAVDNQGAQSQPVNIFITPSLV